MTEHKKIIIERISKLLSLANHSRSNEHEAANAASKAKELLEKYNLTLTDLELKEVGERVFDTEKKKLEVWEEFLCSIIKRLDSRFHK